MTNPSSLQELNVLGPSIKISRGLQGHSSCEVQILKTDPCRKIDIRAWVNPGKSSMEVHSWDNHQFLGGAGISQLLCLMTPEPSPIVFGHALVTGRRSPRSPFWCHHPKMEYLALGGCLPSRWRNRISPTPW